MNFKENSKYLIEQSIGGQGLPYRSILTCHCVQDGYAYLSDTPSSQIYTEKVEYKYNIKKERMYVFNKVFQTWDSVDNYTIAEYGTSIPEMNSTSYKTYTII